MHSSSILAFKQAEQFLQPCQISGRDGLLEEWRVIALTIGSETKLRLAYLIMWQGKEKKNYPFGPSGRAIVRNKNITYAEKMDLGHPIVGGFFVI